MSYQPPTRSLNLNTDEWNELVSLKEAITYRPSSVSAHKMERFTELMVRSLEGKGDLHPNQNK